MSRQHVLASLGKGGLERRVLDFRGLNAQCKRQIWESCLAFVHGVRAALLVACAIAELCHDGGKKMTK